MKKVEVVSKKSPQVVGPYSQAIKIGNLVFVSGHIGTDPKTNMFVGDDIKSQTKQVFANLKAVLEAAGTGMDNVLKVNVYLKSMNDFLSMNEIYANSFKKPYPARATVEVARLPKDALVEMDCIAYLEVKKECCGSDCCREE